MGLFKTVEETKLGLKVLGYGASGTGKTTFGLSFNDGDICAIDSEDGMTWYKGKKNPHLKYILNSTSADDVEEGLEEIEEELIDKISTFILDSETKIYENMQHSVLNIAEKRAKRKGQSVEDSNISTREWGKIKLVNKRIQSTKIMLASKGINIVSIAQEKELKEKKGENFVVVGHAPDTAKGFEYDYDIVLRFFTEEDSKTKELIYKAEVKKDRTETYKKGSIIINPSYDCWREVAKGKQNLKENIVNYKNDIDKDQEVIQTELDTLDDLVEKFKTNFKGLDADKKVQIKDKLKELKIENPLSCTNLDSMKKLVLFINKLNQ